MDISSEYFTLSPTSTMVGGGYGDNNMLVYALVLVVVLVVLYYVFTMKKDKESLVGYALGAAHNVVFDSVRNPTSEVKNTLMQPANGLEYNPRLMDRDVQAGRLSSFEGFDPTELDSCGGSAPGARGGARCGVLSDRENFYGGAPGGLFGGSLFDETMYGGDDLEMVMGGDSLGMAMQG